MQLKLSEIFPKKYYGINKALSAKRKFFWNLSKLINMSFIRKWKGKILYIFPNQHATILS